MSIKENVSNENTSSKKSKKILNVTKFIYIGLIL